MDTYDQAVSIAQTLLRGTPVTAPLIVEAVERVTSLLTLPERFDTDALIKDLESRANVWVGSAVVLDSNEGHQPWLEDRTASIEWAYWHRYERYLEEELSFAPSTVRALGGFTDDILRRLEDPQRSGPWDRRGLIVGEVQSGKTSNYAGLICKAADAGYRLIVVLAGRTNSLRAQTQIRLDESFLGFDTRTSRIWETDTDGTALRGGLIGVGKLNFGQLRPMSGTTSEEIGDFNRVAAEHLGIVPGGAEPVILVVKKHVSILKNLLTWATGVLGQEDPETNVKVVRDVPLLVIDDEADEASVNTNPDVDDAGRPEPDQDPTATNQAIRSLLRAFDRSAYVGYTATPFANVFIHPEVSSPELGPDLFPRHFIISLPSPSNHVGPSKVFGLAAGADIDSQQGLPIVSTVLDHGTWLPEGHRIDQRVGPIPGSLREAIRAFILSCAARIARGQGTRHNSMLVHVTRFTGIQGVVADQVADELRILEQRLRYGDGSAPAQILEELEDLWKRDFAPAHSEIVEREPDIGATLTPLDWSDVKTHIHSAAARIRVKTINGSANDALEYWNYPNGLSVIAIGGNKLSRGLTLEGLTVSYYLRASKMYDTLMQMGRWFGYRDGYLDLCRLYTTKDLQEWYKHIALAAAELRVELEEMSARGLTPDDFGLRVLTHPSGLKITGAGKMRHGTPMRVSFAGRAVESLVLARGDVEANFGLVDSLIGELRTGVFPEDRQRRTSLWTKVPGERIAEFFALLRTHESSLGADSTRIAAYIRRQLDQNELTDWSVLLASVETRGTDEFEIGGELIGLSTRSAPHDEDKISMNRVISESHEARDLDPFAAEQALAETVKRWEESQNPRKAAARPTVPSGPTVRAFRPKEHGHLMLYPLAGHGDVAEGAVPVAFAVSFPASGTARSVEYQVNDRYRQLEMQGL